MRDLAAAIEFGDAGYRRLCRRLDCFGTWLAVVRLRLSTARAGRSASLASKDETVAVSTSARRSRQPRAMPLRIADGGAV
jgi:hypothetical protein